MNLYNVTFDNTTFAGVIHVVLIAAVQLYLGIKIEKSIGFIRIMLIYIISGVGGNLVCRIYPCTLIQCIIHLWFCLYYSLFSISLPFLLLPPSLPPSSSPSLSLSPSPLSHVYIDQCHIHSLSSQWGCLSGRIWTTKRRVCGIVPVLAAHRQGVVRGSQTHLHICRPHCPRDSTLHR